MPVLFERLLFGRSRHRFLCIIMYSGVFAALIFSWALTEPLIFTRSPYEGWDECMAYTQATRMSLTTRFENATYGSIEEFKFRIAKFIYKQFDPVGKNLSPRRWTNNVLSSYLKPSAIFESPSFDWTYSRGILDRRPFLIARYVNTIGGLILAATLSAFWLVRYRYQALFLIVPLLWFLVSAGYLGEAVVAVTPNAWNALLAVMAFVCLTDVIERRRPVGLYISAALVAVGANEKIDFLFLGAPVAVTWIVADFEAETFFRRWIRPALLCVVLFLAALISTNPRLLYALPLVIGEQCRLLSQAGPDAADPGHSGVGYNGVQLVNEFLNGSLGVPRKLAKLHSFRITAILGVCLLFPLSVMFSSDRDTRRKRSMLVVWVLFYVSLWLVPLLVAGHAYPRYFLSGSAVAMISVGYACRNLWRENSRLGRSLGLLVLCLCAISCLSQAKQVSLRATRIKERLDSGLDRMVTRNQAVLEMIRLIESGNYSKQVIIDQHSYTDIRAFLEKGISVTLINVFNFQREFKKIEPANKPTLGLYVPGNCAAPEEWEGKWNKEECSLYKDYLKQLSGFETIAKFGNHPMFLLDWAPVNYADEVVIFEVPGSPEARSLPEARSE